LRNRNNKSLVYDDEVILKKDGITVQLTGRSYNYEIDGENFRNYYIVKNVPMWIMP